jgi:hypothetical protein
MGIDWEKHVLGRCHRGINMIQERTIGIDWEKYVSGRCHRGINMIQERTILKEKEHRS